MAIRSIKQAFAASRRREWDEALPALARYLGRGKHQAHVALAEKAAYEQHWPDAATHAAAALGRGAQSFHTANVECDMVRLLVASTDAGHGELVHEVLTVALAAQPGSGRVVRARMAEAAAATRDGVPADSTLRRWGLSVVHAPTADRRAWFERAVAEPPKWVRRDPSAMPRHRFALASHAGLDDVWLDTLAEHPEDVDFEMALDCGRALVRRGDPEAAWAAIRPRLDQWDPVEQCQIASVPLITDPLLAGVMNPARCLEVLATPVQG